MADTTDEFAYINRQYGLSIKRGTRLRYTGGKDGPRTGAVAKGLGQYIDVRFDDAPTKIVGPFHPTWEMRYLDEEPTP